MSIEWSVKPGNLIELVVSGQLVFEEYLQVQSKLESTVREAGKSGILVLLRDFAGWDTNKGWGDSSATERTDPFISKMAIVGDEKWRDLVEVFTLKGLRPIPIEYFSADKEQEARDWLKS